MIKQNVGFFALFVGLMLCVYLTSQAARVQGSCHSTSTKFMCVKYLYNYDGDTITVEIPDVHPLFGHQIAVRVNGIDTAEKVTANDCEHKAAIRSMERVNGILSSAKRINLLNVERDKYFRILADVQADGILLKNVLLEEKLAVDYDGGAKTKVDWCSYGNQKN